MAVLGDTIINGVLRVNGKISSSSGSGGDFNIDKVYPVGAIYMSVVNTNPGTLFGGTWVRWGNGRVPVGINENDGDFNTAEKTGGAKTVTLTASNLPSHTHTYAKSNATSGSTALNTNQIPSHTHGSKTLTGTFALDSNGIIVRNSAPYCFRDNSGIVALQNVAQDGQIFEYTGGGSSQIKHMWRDKILINASHEHSSVGGNQGHTHSVSTTSTSTGSTGSGSAVGIQQQYITCYMWKRTA